MFLHSSQETVKDKYLDSLRYAASPLSQLLVLPSPLPPVFAQVCQTLINMVHLEPSGKRLHHYGKIDSHIR